MRRKSWILENGLSLAWAVALTATVGSLYFSEVVGFIPCNLCWYQRILMYPLVLLLGIAAVRKDWNQTLYVLPMCVVGLSISVYHYLLEKTTWFDTTHGNVCGIVPCDTLYINWFGFVTIPFLAGTAFIMIAVLSVMIRKAARNL